MTVGIGLVLTGAVVAQNGSLAWARRAGGNNIDEGLAATLDGNGNVFTTGYFKSTATFGLGEANETVLTSLSQDLFVAKHDASDNLLWVKMAVGGGGQFALDIAIDPQGGSYVTGYGSGLTFGAEEDGQVSLGGVGAQDVFVAGFNSDGLTQWARLAGGSSDDRGLGVAHGGGAVHVGGRFGQTATFGSGEPNQTALTSRGNFDIFTAKFQVGTIVLLSPAFAGYTLLPNGHPQLTLSGTAAGTYAIRRTGNIASPTWTDLGDVTLDGEGRGTFEDPDEALTFPAFCQATGN